MVVVAYTFVDKQQTLGPELQSKFVFTHPRHLASLRLDHRLPGGFDAGWQVAAKERKFLEDFAVVDLVLSRSFAYGRSLLRVSNLTDQRYQAVRGVPQPGRWVSLETRFGLETDSDGPTRTGCGPVLPPAAEGAIISRSLQTRRWR